MVGQWVVRGGVLTLAVIAFAGSAFAQHRGSMEDQLACTPDVYRLCSSFVPDEDAIVVCLKKNIKALSPACHQVFTRPNSPAASQGSDDQDQD